LFSSKTLTRHVATSAAAAAAAKNRRALLIKTHLCHSSIPMTFRAGGEKERREKERKKKKVNGPAVSP